MTIDCALYVIMCAHRRGAYSAERDVNDMNLESTISDIMSGEVTDVERVFAFNPAEGWSHEVTDAIARAIKMRLAGEAPSDSVREFIAMALGEAVS